MESISLLHTPRSCDPAECGNGCCTGKSGESARRILASWTRRDNERCALCVGTPHKDMRVMMKERKRYHKCFDNFILNPQVQVVVVQRRCLDIRDKSISGQGTRLDCCALKSPHRILTVSSKVVFFSIFLAVYLSRGSLD